MEMCHLIHEEEKKSFDTLTPSMYSHLILNRINIKAYTWPKNSYGLYDYETLDVVKNTLMVDPGTSKVILCRCVNEVLVCSESEYELLVKNCNIQKLASVTSQSGKFFVRSFSDDTELYNNRLWFVVRSLKVSNPDNVYFLYSL